MDDLLQQLTSGKRSSEQVSDGEEDSKKFKVEEEGVDDAR